MNYLRPVNNPFVYENENQFLVIKDNVEDILTQQIIISQLSSGITYKDTEEMDSYERIFIFKKLVQMEKDKNDAKLRAIENMNQK